MKTTIGELSRLNIKGTPLHHGVELKGIIIPILGHLFIDLEDFETPLDLLDYLENKVHYIETLKRIRMIENMPLEDGIEELQQQVYAESYQEYLIKTYPWLQHTADLAYKLRLDIVKTSIECLRDRTLQLVRD